MRRVFLRVILVLAACCGVAACGSSSAGAPNPVNAELSYFPESSPLVMTIATDPNGQQVRNAGSLAAKFPVVAFGEAYLKSKLQQLGINYDTDIHPLFGNPIALGVSEPTGPSTRTLLIAWVTKDASALGSLVQKLHLQKSRTYDGATLYATSTAAVAVNGATVVLASTQGAVMSALDRHVHGGGVTQADFASAVAGLPEKPLIEAFGNLAGVLSGSRAAKARLVPWVAALRGYAVALTASSGGLNFQYRLDTSGAPLTSTQLPIASGTAPPSLAGTMPISVGLQDPSHLVAFVEQAQQASDPSGYAVFLKQQAAERRKTGVDVNSLLRLLTGGLVIDSDTHTTIGRAAVSDPAAAAGVLAKLASAPRNVFGAGTSVTRGPGGFYLIKDKRTTVTLGVVGSQLVGGEGTPAQLRSFAAAPSTPAPAGSKGSVAYRIALPALLQLAVKHAPAQLQSFLASLGDITGWTAANPRESTGEATLTLK